MDALTELFEKIRSEELSKGLFLGLLHVLIGRTVTAPAGTVLSTGMTFREAATWLKKLRWNTEDVRELGLDPDALPLRDRQRYWFVAICNAQVGSAEAVKAGEKFAAKLRTAGYGVK
jgi:hypothetical protein